MTNDPWPLAHIISSFRSRFQLSKAAAGRILGMSTLYMRSLEAGHDVKTGLPFVPREATLRQIAGKMDAFGFPMTYERLAEAVISKQACLQTSDARLSGAPSNSGHDSETRNITSVVPPHKPVLGLPGLRLVTGMTTLPVWRIPCGEPIELFAEPLEYRDYPSEWAEGIDAVMIVKGDSMEGCGFGEDDELLVKALQNGERPNTGNKVIAEIDGESTCKIYRKDELGEYLESAPATGSPKRWPFREGVRLIAVVRRRVTNEV